MIVYKLSSFDGGLCSLSALVAIYSNLVVINLSKYMLMYPVKLPRYLLIHKSERDKFCS